MWTRFVFCTILIVAHTIQAFSLKNNEDKKWEPLKTLITGWEFTKNFSVSIGDASGNLFTRKFIFFAKHTQYSKYQSTTTDNNGDFTMHTQIPTGSTSKWPSAMMFAGMVIFLSRTTQLRNAPPKTKHITNRFKTARSNPWTILSENISLGGQRMRPI